MAISGIGSNYGNVYEGTYATQKHEALKKTETKEAAPAQTGKVKNTLEKAEDSKKAKELEDFIKKIPELEKQGYEQLSAQNKALGGTVTYYQQTWTINKDGSIQSTVYSVTETDMTNAEKMKKSMDERLKKQKEKKEEEEKVKERKEEKAEKAEKPEKETEKISVSEVSGQISSKL